MADLDFSGDQALFDSPEGVTFTSVRLAGNATVAGIADATFDFVSLREAADSNGAHQAGDVSFSIRQSLLAAVGGAKPGDRVLREADGQTYTVLTATPTVFTRVWDLVCRNLILANDLRDVGTLSRPAVSPGAAGRPTKGGYADVITDVPCRVQPEGGRATDAAGKRTIPKRFTAYLGQPVDARAGDRFVSAGVSYTVVGTKNPDRIDKLMSLDLERLDP